MPWWDRSNAVCRRALLIGLVVATGCAHSQADLQDRLSQRVSSVRSQEARSSSKAAVNAVRRESKDAAVHPAVALQPTERAQAPSQPTARPRYHQQSFLLHGVWIPIRCLRRDVASERLRRGHRSTRSPPTGKPLTLPEAIELAFRLQPRLRAQLETSPRPAGSSRSRSRRSCRLSPANYDVGGFSLGVGGNSIRLEEPPGFNFLPGLGAVPVGLNLGTTFELAELKVQWLLLDFGRRLGRYEQARLATDIAGLQTERAYQTVANEVAVAYYNVLRSQALRRTAQDALRRAEEELADARKRAARGRHRARGRPAGRGASGRDRFRQLHAATEAEFVALAAAEPGDRAQMQ